MSTQIFLLLVTKDNLSYFFWMMCQLNRTLTRKVPVYVKPKVTSACFPLLLCHGQAGNLYPHQDFYLPMLKVILEIQLQLFINSHSTCNEYHISDHTQDI